MSPACPSLCEIHGAWLAVQTPRAVFLLSTPLPPASPRKLRVRVCLVYREKRRLLALGTADRRPKRRAGRTIWGCPSFALLWFFQLLYLHVSVDFSNPVSKRLVSLPLGLRYSPRASQLGRVCSGTSVLLSLQAVSGGRAGSCTHRRHDLESCVDRARAF